ncbi:Spermidine N(1)-acetyltransferase [Cytospora mali]|uniref:Spermidine N(1)-acetyltransferase n=1 Tax=Cytospora mali TaxID=578113 RepID=A0A194VG03_CYTMA|nr:Spermidine N(1)-acetyltransferase [Valsa mali var. pyri (nom. inval.)]
MAEPWLEDLENVWYSERLVFRAVQQEDYDFFFTSIDIDPITQSLASPGILKPPRKEKPEDWFEGRKKHNYLLDVMICLSPDVELNRKHFTGAPASDTGDAKPKDEGEECKKPEPKPIGMLELSPIVYGREAKNRACMFGIVIASPYHNSGYGTEAVNWTLDWAFRQANLHSIHLGSVEYNKRAHKCYQKCGFKFDGRQRQCHWHDRKWYDLYLFSIIEDEWEEMRNGGN